MLVISDTSPLTALLLTGRERLLKQIFDRVVIPTAVEKELLRAHAALPAWIEILSPPDIPSSVSDAGLDPGETEAISLALKLRPDVILMDERLGRRLAARHGLKVTGLLGLLVMARQKNLIEEVRPLIHEVIEKADAGLTKSSWKPSATRWGNSEAKLSQAISPITLVTRSISASVL